MQAAVKLDHQLLAVEGEHDVHAMLELSLPEAKDAVAQPPLRLALVLDRSGSMAGDKLAVAQRCAAWLVSRLRPVDELALVSYDDEVRLLAPLAPVREGPLRAAVAGLRPGGSTNLSGGWLRGLEQVRGSRREDPPAHGRDRQRRDHGTRRSSRSSRGPAPARESARRRSASAPTSTRSCSRRWPTPAAATRTGRRRPTRRPAIFARELEGLTSVAAQNVSVELRPGPHVELLGVLNEYPQVRGRRAASSSSSATPTRARRGASSSRSTSPTSPRSGRSSVGELVIRLRLRRRADRPPRADGARRRERRCPRTRRLRSRPIPEVREEVLVLQAARARDEAIRLADAGGHADARELLSAQHAELRAAGLVREADDVLAAAELVSADRYDAVSRKSLHYRSQQSKRGRP